MQETMSTQKQDKKREDWRGIRERRDMIGQQLILEKTIHWGYSFYEQCLYDMASIETTNGVLCWD